MSLVLCKCRAAEQPFYIRSGKLNIYSLEELLFYAVGAVFIDKEDFLNREFTGWIRKDLENTELADVLDKKLKSGVSLVDFFKPIEEASGYLSEVQTGKLNLSLNKFDHMSPLELGKRLADDFLNKGMLKKAILTYKKLLSEMGDSQSSSSVVGDILHNQGVAYARFFDFHEAYNCFVAAYRSNHRVESLNEAVDCAVLAEDNSLLKELNTLFKTSYEHIEKEVKRASSIHTSSLMEARKNADQPFDDINDKYLAACED